MNKNKIIFLYDNNFCGYEIFDINDLEYWLRRRNEKGNGYPKKAFVLGDEIDIQSMIRKIEKDDMDYEEKLREETERAEYERLKKKYE